MLKRKRTTVWGRKKGEKLWKRKQNHRQERGIGKGSIPKLLAQLAIPVVVAQIVNLLYNIVDRIYIGHIPGIGAAALTGVGLFAPILMLINAFAMLSGSGGAPRAAIFMGKRDNETAEKIMANCFSLILIFAVGLTILFSIFAPSFLFYLELVMQRCRMQLSTREFIFLEAFLC